MRTMKRLWGIMTALALVFPFLAFGQSTTYYDRSYTRMSYVQGDVYVQRAQDQGYEKGEINLVVVQGDKIGSRAGRLEIQLGRRNYLRLDNDTQVDLANLPGRDGDPTKLHVLAGSIFLRVQTLDREKNFEVHTPDASFYLLTAGSYRVDVRENRETEFSVLSGSAEAAGEEGSVAIEDGHRIIASNGRFTSEAVSLLARRDDFGAWNDTRDGSYARPAGQTYLPAEYSDYENELDENGSWVNEADYGNVWVPRGVNSDWRPYSYGRWVWYPIIGWTWVSSDSWGWCTHHYGRWGWGLGLGWYWIPRDHWGWGPAWVNWWNDDYYVGWCPLSYWGYPAVIYNNRFFGRYGYGDYYNYSHFARTMTMVDRNRLWDRNIGRASLGADRLRGRVDRISLGAHQPNIRPSLDRADGISSRAASVLGRENLRSVSRGYSGNGRRLNTEELRSSVGRVRSGEGSSSAGSRIIRDGAGTAGLASRSRESVSGNTGRQIRSYPSNGARESTMRALPSTRSGSGRSVSSSGSPARSTSGRSGDGSSTTMRSYPSRSTDSSSSRNSSIRSYSPSRSQGNSGSSSSSSSRSSSGTREYRSRSSVGRSDGSSSSSSAPSRSYSAPSRSYSAPSRSSSAPSSSRSYSAPSRSYSAPSRSYSAPSSSRSYSAPSRSSSSGSSSRSYSAPSRSYSAPSSSRSYSAPSRSSSSGSSSRSYSAPSRSSSGSSRGSSSSSSGRSSGGSARRR